MKTSIKLLLMFCVTMAFGQKHTVEGEIKPVTEAGLHHIPVPYNFRTHATADLRDLRILDTQGNQVPYFLKSVTAFKTTQVSDFTEYAVISSSRVTDSTSTYIFENPDKAIKQAVFLIANYQGNKSYKLEGSNNKTKWFGIVNNGQLNNLSHPEDTQVYKVINFPLGAYRYLKVVFNDKHSLPINLLKIGKVSAEKETISPIKMDDIPVKTISYSEENKKTLVHITFERPEVIHQMKLNITEPALYSRNATLYTLKSREEKHNKETYKNFIATLSIRSDNDLVFNIPTTVEGELYLEIDNKDNPKLEISSISFMQKPVYMVAALKPQTTYRVTAGDKALNFPDYDISEVANTLKNMLPTATITSINTVKQTGKAVAEISFWQQPWFMWCCIGVAALIIAFYASNLIKDLNKKQS
ncbi:hypothetical protein ACFFU1_06620 [Algibacter miyuki]|uniref:DUF3999 domain-containing protein n=1 Tax=Algibacter miyuki TaxID=1306933 RepID=A0ABV5GY55_9FLAO|nr:hypothetical protein [Algibacter miyuki]MDN3667239.1 hypothetical protein [Algibacter miyuki]